MLDVIRKTPFVAFVGAGASAVAPAQLPGWTQFNDLLLECLCDRLAEYSRARQPTAQMLAAFRARRDGFFAPDFQAQLIEEEIGADYFRVWQSIDSDLYGPVHAALAELAAAGRLAAIITTNFDRLIEKALAARGVAFDVFHDEPRFAQFPASRAAALPILKIHGSIEDSSSLIDTLKQRLVGRPLSLMQAIAALLRQSPWLYLGFSGADFGYDPHYLGILDGAPDAKGFVFLSQSGKDVKPGVLGLRKAYGEEKAEIVQGDLKTWLAETFGLAQLPAPPPGPPPKVKERIAQWVGELGDISVVNILCSMLRSCGLEPEAHWLLRKTFKSYRSGEDTRGPSYSRYNYNYGLSLLERGFIRNKVSLADDMSNLLDWKRAADQNGFEFLARAYKLKSLLPAGAALASLLALRGEVGRAIDLAAEVDDAAITKGAKADRCDIAIFSATIWDIVRIFKLSSEHLVRCVDLAREIGDEPRRAALCAHAARFLINAGEEVEADRFLRDAEDVANRLELGAVLLQVRAVRGLRLQSTDPSAALTLLQEVRDVLHAQDDIPVYTHIDLGDPALPQTVVKGKHPMLCRVLLDLLTAAMLAADNGAINATLDELDELTVEHFLGYCPHYYLGYVECLIHSEPVDRQLISTRLAKARQLGEQEVNPWVAQAAGVLEQQFQSAVGGLAQGGAGG